MVEQRTMGNSVQPWDESALPTLSESTITSTQQAGGVSIETADEISPVFTNSVSNLQFEEATKEALINRRKKRRRVSTREEDSHFQDPQDNNGHISSSSMNL